MSVTRGADLRGTLHRFPFLGTDLGERAAPVYERLADEHGVEDVLVVKRFPTDADEIASTFGDAVEDVERPTVVGLSRLALQVLEELPDPPRRLSRAESNLLLDHFVATRDWETPYLARAAASESFAQDVQGFVAEATWQGQTIETDDPVLEELAATAADYHEWLASADALDGARVLGYVTELLAEDRPDALRAATAEAVLVLEFEEFTPIDRAFLAEVVGDADLVCVAEADSAIQRTWNEPGPITDYAPGLTSGTDDDPATPTDPGGRRPSADTDGQGSSTASDGRAPASVPDAIATFLATGDEPALPETGTARVLETATFDDQVLAIADEIERLRREEGRAYEEMAVVLRDSNAPIPETLRGLRAAGVPVASATVGGLEHDPAARELFALACWCRGSGISDGAGPGDDDASAAGAEGVDGTPPGWERERARSVLDARVDELADDLLERVREVGAERGIHDALGTWLVETDLKDRIAADEDPLSVRVRFRHVADALSLAEALDRSDLLAPSWARYCRALETEMDLATGDAVATTLALPEGGVLVDAVRVVKNTARDVVFVPDVVDSEYPADPGFNALFPTPHIGQLDAYPAFTTPTAEDVARTFRHASPDGTRPLQSYYAALSRRLLAVATRTAGERVYYGVFEEDRGAGSGRLQPSRFLAAIEDAYGPLERVDGDDVHSHGGAVRAAIDGVDRALEGVRRAGLVDEPVDLGDVEADFAAIQSLLAAEPPPDLEDAIRARVDFAKGAVRRE